jgi:plastocyanin
MKRSTGLLLALIVVVAGGAALVVHFSTQQAPPAPPPPAPQAVATPAPVPSAPVAPVGKGSLSGVVMLTGTPPVMEPLKRGADPACRNPMNDEWALVKDGRIENAYVHIKGGPNAPGPTAAVEVDQKDCMYRPRVQGAVAGQDVTIRNTDATLHNVHAYGGAKTLFNRAQPPKSAPLDEKLNAGDVVKFKCDVHPWMTGYVLVNNNPWFAVTGADGSFQIKDVPAGTYTLETWHERFGTKTQTVTVAPDQKASANFTYSADDRG